VTASIDEAPGSWEVCPPALPSFVGLVKRLLCGRMRWVVLIAAIPWVSCSASVSPTGSAVGPSSADVQTHGLASMAGCVVTLASTAELQSELASGQLGLPVYWTTDAAWAGAHPILVGRDFDFSLALGDMINPGLAASMRQQGNRETAEKLAALGDIGLAPAFMRAIAADARSCEPFAGKQVWLYAFLYGTTDARVQVVLRMPGAPGAANARGTTDPSAPTQFIAVSSAHPLNGEQSWLDGDGHLLREAVQAGASLLARLATGAYLSTQPGACRLRCPIGGTEAWTGTGSTMDKPNQQQVVRTSLDGLPSTTTACSSEGAGPP
jgi:hypothetical protein